MTVKYAVLTLVSYLLHYAYGQIANCNKFFIEDSNPGYWYSLYNLDLNGVPYNMAPTNLSDWISHLGFYGVPFASGNTKSMTINNFATVPENEVQYGEVYGNNITTTNFSMVASAWYIPQKTGWFQFTLHAYSAGELSITNYTSAYCCSHATNIGIDEQFTLTSIPSMPEVQNPSGQVYLYEGFKYQMLMSYINLNGSAYFYIEEKDPDGAYTTTDWSVQQMNKQNASELVTCNYTVGYTTTTVPWTGLSTIEEIQEYYKIISGHVTFQVWDLIGTPYGPSSSITHLTSGEDSSSIEVSTSLLKSSSSSSSLKSSSSSSETVASSSVSAVESIISSMTSSYSSSIPSFVPLSLRFTNSFRGYSSSSVRTTSTFVESLPNGNSKTKTSSSSTSTSESDVASSIISNATSIMSVSPPTEKVSSSTSISSSLSPSTLSTLSGVSIIPKRVDYGNSSITSNVVIPATPAVLSDLNGIADSDRDRSKSSSTSTASGSSSLVSPNVLSITMPSSQVAYSDASSSSFGMISSGQQSSSLISNNGGALVQNRAGSTVEGSEGSIKQSLFSSAASTPTVPSSQPLLSQVISGSSWVPVPPTTITDFSATTMVTTIQPAAAESGSNEYSFAPGEIAYAPPNCISLEGILPNPNIQSDFVAAGGSVSGAGEANAATSYSVHLQPGSSGAPPIIPMGANGAITLSGASGLLVGFAVILLM